MEIEKNFSWNLPYDESEDIIFSLSKGDCCNQGTTLTATTSAGTSELTGGAGSGGGYYWSGGLPGGCGGIYVFCHNEVFSISGYCGAQCPDIIGTITSTSCDPFEIVAEITCPATGMFGFPCNCAGQTITITITQTT